MSIKSDIINASEMIQAQIKKREQLFSDYLIEHLLFLRDLNLKYKHETSLYIETGSAYIQNLKTLIPNLTKAEYDKIMDYDDFIAERGYDSDLNISVSYMHIFADYNIIELIFKKGELYCRGEDDSILDGNLTTLSGTDFVQTQFYIKYERELLNHDLTLKADKLNENIDNTAKTIIDKINKTQQNYEKYNNFLDEQGVFCYTILEHTLARINDCKANNNITTDDIKIMIQYSNLLTLNLHGENVLMTLLENDFYKELDISDKELFEIIKKSDVEYTKNSYKKSMRQAVGEDKNIYLHMLNKLESFIEKMEIMPEKPNQKNIRAKL